MINFKIKIKQKKIPKQDIVIEENSIFKDVKGFEPFYEVSNFGVVRSKERTIICKDGQLKPIKSRCLRPGNNGSGYLFVQLWVDNIPYRKYIHRIVAETFIPNPSNLEEVNHIDGNKSNNAVSNLEWCNRLYNERSKIRNIANYHPNKVLQIDKQGNVIREFESMKQCCRELHHCFNSLQKFIKEGSYITKNGLTYKLTLTV